MAGSLLVAAGQPAAAIDARGMNSVYEIPGNPYSPADPVVALTFDDGPDPTWTPQILNVLDTYGVKATFFETGASASRYPSVTRAVVARSDVVGNHTWNHVDLTKLPADGYPGEVDATTNLLEGLTGQTVRCTRPPYGDSNPAVVSLLAARGQTSVVWSTDTEDFNRPGVGTIVNRALSGLHNGSIILMHDGGGDRSQTVAALPWIISGIQARGYRIVPVCAMPRPPFGTVDSVNDVGGAVRVSGWAVDPDTTSSIDVHVYIDGVLAGYGTATGYRPDVGAALPGFGANHGFDFVIGVWSGAHRVCAYAINVGTATGNPELGCRSLTVARHEPVGNLDLVRDKGSAIRVVGWSFDPDSTSAVVVRIYVDGRDAGSTTAASDRPDVGAAYPGHGSAHGFDATVAATSGRHTVCVYAVNVGVGFGNPPLGCLSVFVLPREPFGNLDVAVDGGRSLRLAGWAIDPDTANPITVHAYVDGRYVGSTTAGGDRPDVGAAFPRYGSSHGFALTVAATYGTHRVCLYGINVGAGTWNPPLGCRDVVVAAEPFGNLDSARGLTAATRLTGWAIDPDTTAPIEVRVYIDGAFAGSTVARATRPDVAVVYPAYGDLHGYDITVPAAKGSRTVCAYGINVSSGVWNPPLGCRTVIVG
jgi:peptidoglycan/xylan/chitin deacetylase (PgdA/CDA1 family)